MAAPTITSKPTSTASAVVAAAPKRNRWKTVAMFVACQLAAILFVECVLYMAGLGEEEFFKFDRQIGFQHMANKRVTWRTEGFAQSYLNEDGMREANLTVQKPANTYRVAVLGDSMVEGFQVPIEQTFGALLDKDLSPLDGKQVQVLNFGTSGYSTAQEYLQLRSKVMKYQPDLVLLCYNSRDIFENWSAPDQVITNVRPAAVKIDGYPLTIDHSPVHKWFRSPRAKMMQATEWLRQNSRIAGLFMAVDLELSQKNMWYRAFINSITKPKNAIKEIQTAWAAQEKQGPAFKINFFEDTSKPKVQTAASGARTAGPHLLVEKPAGTATTSKPDPTQHVFISAATNDTLDKNKLAMAAEAKLPASDPRSPNSSYAQFTKRTLAGLFTAMRSTAASQGAKFAVMSLPARAQLCPLTTMETSFGGIDYAQELRTVSKICAENSIPFIDVEAKAEGLSDKEREALFYVVHLSPEGQKFIAASIAPFIKQQLSVPAAQQ